jgi:hypothetical protein
MLSLLEGHYLHEVEGADDNYHRGHGEGRGTLRDQLRSALIPPMTVYLLLEAPAADGDGEGRQ